MNTIYIFVISLAIILLLTGILLSLLSHFTDAKSSNSADKRIEKLLPNINCGQCGYPGCHAYAEALSKGEAKASLCKPAGPEVAMQLATITGQSLDDKDNYEEELFMPRKIAFIHQNICTGCSRCVRVCRLDCINGKIKQPHHIDENECIGCGDCIKVCPEKCIELTRLEYNLSHYDWKIEATKIGNGAK